MRKLMKKLLHNPGAAALLLCLVFGSGFFLGRWTLQRRSGEVIKVTAERIAAAEVTGQPRIDLNSADAALLETLPGIGPALAERILAYREENGPFRYSYEITNVPGIGESIYDSIRERVTAAP